MGHKLSDTQAKKWAATGEMNKNGVVTPTRTFSEQLGVRGSGSMLLERRPSGDIEVYLAVRRGGRQERKKLGQFGALSAGGQVRETLIKATRPGFFVHEAATPKFASS